MDRPPPRAVARYPDRPKRLNPQRKHGLWLVAISAAVLLANGLVLMLVKEHGLVSDPKTLGILGMPFAVAAVAALVGLAKIVVGRTFGELARAWDDLAGWQRGIVGLLVVGVAFVVLVVFGAVIVSFFDKR
ncbi:MAG: AbgT family transporter [Deltaproteobacteria bacterium]|nr:AbgT family transporter [Deltaproteobacteria bacterium]